VIEYFNEDCMVGMARYPDKYFDLAIVDPPYGIGIDGQKLSISKNPKHDRKEHIQKDWDSHIPNRDYFKELFRVSENQIIWGGNYFVKHLEKGTKGWIVWDKGQHGLTMSDAELAYSSFQKPTRVKVINRVELRKDGTIHPTQKPVALYKWLLTNYAKEGDLILDTHVGSASSLIACHDLGFSAVGFEIDEDYYKASKQRLKDHMAQMRIEDMSNHISGEDDKPEQITLW
jgi:site-specific DNA-methyltransferase (adenine-specific)